MRFGCQLLLLNSAPYFKSLGAEYRGKNCKAFPSLPAHFLNLKKIDSYFSFYI